MEEILDVYTLPYNPLRPVVCMDESSVQLLGEVSPPVDAAPGHPKLIDDEYVRHGAANVFIAVEPLAGRRRTKVTARRTSQDWALFIRELVDETYAEAESVVLVLDNLNTHAASSLYATFPAEEARRIARKLELHYTPKHGSWLNISEIEFSALKRQCLKGRRIPNSEVLAQQIAFWNEDRDCRQTKVDWQFGTNDARAKLKRLYPKF